MNKIAQVWINIPVRTLDKTFSYVIPDKMDFIDTGWRVLVPFGNRKVEGFVVSVTAEGAQDEYLLKPILDVLDAEAWFDENMLKTASWLSSYYLCGIVDAMRLFLPGKSGIQVQSVYHIAPSISNQAKDFFVRHSEEYYRVFAYVEKNKSVSLRQLKKDFGERVPLLVRELINGKLLIEEMLTKKSECTKYVKVVQLVITKDKGSELLACLTKKPAQYRLLSLLMEKQVLGSQELKEYKISQDTVKRLEASGALEVIEKKWLRDSYAHIKAEEISRFQLTFEQQQALNLLRPVIEQKKYQSFLLHGITGSGKTEVYIEAVALSRKMGREAIVLVPEIALTSQIVTRFKARFGDDVVVIHSKLSVAERYDAFYRLRKGQAGIAIGARSAVFAPVPNLGIIVIDEEHEFTYKQEERPRYHTRDVAMVRAKLTGAAVVLGSATPAVETYYRALKGRHVLLSLTSRISHAVLPEVSIVDMRLELQKGRRSVISHPLQELLAETLNKREQAVILLNRRGYATFVMCRECGYIVRCAHCDSSMVYHSTLSMLRCHYCQTTEKPPDVCPKCQSRYIRYFGTGTQKLEEELAKLFPKAKVVRMDQDTTGGKMAHDRIMGAFSKGEYDILLGTQMVAKGHDIKNVTAVGIIAADAQLNLPDFRSAERTFALLTQAAGRAGRGDRPGKVIVQTYNPEHYAIQFGAAHDYKGFYEAEMACRTDLHYPPLGRLLKITAYQANEKQVWQQAEEISQALSSRFTLPQTEIIGPFAAAVFKVKDTFRLNILVKAEALTPIKEYLHSSGITKQNGIIIDVEPMNVM
jgi:primosomal protein N' (replication factor Y)